MVNTRKNMRTQRVFNVFQPGLIRGEASFAHKPEKKVFFIQHPTEGWRVFLRAVCFIHSEGSDPRQFVVLKKTGRSPSENSWEAPKGQMEGKDGLAHPTWSVRRLLEENIRREVKEEAKISRFTKLSLVKHLVLEAKEEEYGPNDYFQYHVFRAVVSPSVLQRAMGTFDYYKAHPEEFAALSSDDNEKDDLAWYSPRNTKLMGRWSPTLVKLYLGHGLKRSRSLK
jgi:8-oxo-dGTP pyrophosphatase MutT (NUDIX family)